MKKRYVIWAMYEGLNTIGMFENASRSACIEYAAKVLIPQLTSDKDLAKYFLDGISKDGQALASVDVCCNSEIDFYCKNGRKDKTTDLILGEYCDLYLAEIPENGGSTFTFIRG